MVLADRIKPPPTATTTGIEIAVHAKTATDTPGLVIALPETGMKLFTQAELERWCGLSFVSSVFMLWTFDKNYHTLKFCEAHRQ